MLDKFEDLSASVRLVSADYYMTSPHPGLDVGYSAYRGSETKRVPVIRVFGSTSNGNSFIVSFDICRMKKGLISRS